MSNNYISLYNETNGTFDNLTIDGDLDLTNANVTVNSIKFADGTVSLPSITFINDIDTGIYRKGDNSISVTCGGVEIANFQSFGVIINNSLQVNQDVDILGQCSIQYDLDVTDGNIQCGNRISSFALSGSLTFPNFTISAPSGEPNLGMYYNSYGTLSFTAGGSECLRLKNDKVFVYSPFHVPDGTLTSPAYTFASAYNLGLYKSATNTLSVASNNTQVIDFKDDKITSYKNIYNIDGSSSSPAYSFSSATNLGIYKNSANTLSITSNGTEVARFNNSLNQMYVPLAMGTNSINCGPITSTGQISSATLVVAGSIQGGTTNIGNLFCNNIISSGYFTNGSNTMTTGAITSSGNFTNGTNSMTTGALSCSSLISSGSIQGGITNITNLFCNDIISTGYFTNTNYVRTPLADIGGTSFLPGVPSKLQIYGSPANISCVSALDNLTVFHIVGNDHNQIGHFMDCYFNGTQAISSSINSNFVFAKNFNELQITTCSGVPPGSPFTGSRLCTAWNTLGNMINYYKMSIGGSIINNHATRLHIYGVANSTDSPNISCITTQDNYPTYHLVNKQHDAIYQCFDCYWDGTNFKSSSGSNYIISKETAELRVLYSAFVSSSSNITPSVASYWDILGNFTTNNRMFIGGSLIAGSASRLQIYGNMNSTTSPNISCITSEDNYPTLHILNSAHNNIVMSFDAYYDGLAFRSSNAVSNFQIGKTSNQLRFFYNQSATAQGFVVPMLIGAYMNTSGNFVFNQNVDVQGELNLTGQPYLTMSASTFQVYTNNTNVDFAGWDTKIDDQGGITCIGNKTFQVPVAGVYKIVVAMNYDISSTGQRSVWILFGNRYGTATTNACSSGETRITTSVILKFNAGNAFTIRCHQNCGANLGVGSLTAGILARISIIKMA